MRLAGLAILVATAPCGPSMRDMRRGSRATTGSQGDRLAIWFERVEGGRACDVRILARKAAIVTIDVDEWPPYFFRQMKVTAAADAAE